MNAGGPEGFLTRRAVLELSACAHVTFDAAKPFRRGTVTAVPAVYVAGPLGFSEPGRHYLTHVLHPRLAAAGWSVLDPWEDPTGAVAETLALPAGPARREALVRMSRAIGERNRNLLAAADAVLAVLDGPDVDSGTAAEVGWAAAHHVPVVGWRSDFRLADHEAAPVNLQVEDFVLVSGGTMAVTLDEAVAALDRLRPV
jgi:nucleoside 2-deoxyribosyltransferase